MLKLELKLDLKLKLDRTAKPNLDGAEEEEGVGREANQDTDTANKHSLVLVELCYRN